MPWAKPQNALNFIILTFFIRNNKGFYKAQSVLIYSLTATVSVYAGLPGILIVFSVVPVIFFVLYASPFPSVPVTVS